MMRADCYAVLGLQPDADQMQVKKAFRKKALQLHPDQGGDEQAFRELQTAFEYLMKYPLVEDIKIGFDSRYDPFADPDYDRRTFFAPENDAIAEFERSVRAQDCPYCHGLGVISKLVNPDQGFMGREERFCRCQVVE